MLRITFHSHGKNGMIGKT